MRLFALPASRGPLRHLTPAALLAVALAYGVGFWLVALHHAEGVHEPSELPLLLHWLRDSTLALPLVLVAVAAAVLASRLLPGRVRSTGSAVLASLATSVALPAASPVHGWMFGVEQHNGESYLAHVLRDSGRALFVAVPLALAVASFFRGRKPKRAAPQAVVVAGPSLTRRRLLKYGVVGAATAGFSGAGAWRAYADSFDDALADDVDPCFKDSPVGPLFAQELPIPPALPPVEQAAGIEFFEIAEQRGEVEIVPGIKTPIWGYNGLFPGPTILGRKGRAVQIRFTNLLPANEDPGSLIVKQEQDHPFRASSTVVHMHGINTDPKSDGYPEDRKDPGQSQDHHYPLNEYQRPATFWYHDHSLHITSRHVYRGGLSGFFIVTDENEDALNLPKGYGVHDVPLLIKDLMIDPRTGVLVYDNCSDAGALGDVMTVNGKQQPRFDVGTRKYRFRILNGSDKRQYLLAFRLLRDLGREPEDAVNKTFFVIGADQGLLAAPALTDRAHIAPAERIEIVFDFSRFPVGTRLVLVNLLVKPEERKLFPLMAFDVTRAETDESTVSPVLRPAQHPADVEAPAQRRTFQFHREDGYWSINGKQWDANRVDAFPVVDTTEEWTLFNDSGGWGHPVHLHLGRFRIVEIQGRRPRPDESGFKDTVWVGPNQTIRIVHQFWNFTGRYVFHCHNGSHEDSDMMSQFEVVPG